MVMNSPLVVGVAKLSADWCQYVACNPERLSSEQVLRLIFCFPFQQFRRFAICLWTFFCFPSPNMFLSTSSSSSSLSSSSSYSSESVSDLDRPHSD